MEIFELRIGNRIIDPFGDEMTIGVLEGDDTYGVVGRDCEEFYNIEECRGIPVTSELLYELGFSYKKGTWFIGCGVGVLSLFPAGGGVCYEAKYKGPGLSFKEGHVGVVTFLHEIQNLIYTKSKRMPWIDAA